MIETGPGFLMMSDAVHSDLKDKNVDLRQSDNDLKNMDKKKR
jgi:hypothetical protein